MNLFQMNRHLPPKLGIFAVAMITVAGIFSIRDLPVMAEYGLTLVTYYILGAILYFIPSTLICAELATTWPKRGGLYRWVREAFGPRTGFLAIWLEWTNTIVSLPAILSFAVVTLFYLINPALIQHKWLMISLMLILLWSTTLFNLIGIRTSLFASSYSTILGIIIPAVIIGLLGLIWFIVGEPLHVRFNISRLIPNLHWNNAAFLAGLILNYAGMQISGFHAQDLSNPQHHYSRAMFIATGIILLLSISGALAVAIVMPQKNIILVAGLMQVVELFFHVFHLGVIAPFIGALILLGFITSFNVWLIGPSRGLAVCAQYGNLPKWLRYTNQKETPTHVLIVQGIISSLLSLIFIFMPNISSSYWLLTVLTAQLTFLMNVLLFASVIRLRYSQPQVKRHYKIPGGKFGLWLIAGLPIVVVIAAFIIGFSPPKQIKTGNIYFYELFLICGIILFIAPAFFIKHKPNN